MINDFYILKKITSFLESYPLDKREYLKQILISDLDIIYSEVDAVNLKKTQHKLKGICYYLNIEPDEVEHMTTSELKGFVTSITSILKQKNMDTKNAK